MFRIFSKLCGNARYCSKILPSLNSNNQSTSFILTKKVHTTKILKDLMEFFDDKKNWGESEVKVGRHWQLDELRIKSNVDLHKLWYILLKERNMLLTMEHECNENMQLFPSPERLDKVKISMRNLETVVRERNRAYHELETGESGERPGQMVTNSLGYNFYYKSCEHVIPQFMNSKWYKTHKFDSSTKVPLKFQLLYREKLYNQKRRAKNRRRNEVMMLLRRNPGLDKNLLQERFPDVDIPKLIQKDKTRGHFVPEIEKK
ncbi:39S ribosomal protein L47, mitochondrial [Condylostylus longicornis]|uniref:39S ribosomal protein L47, mitochondrial n=1 Tax=Condylostylus longicornis TaxID=2530218 RepID=UPI00244E01AC|nr:39S ribosomal protein L47, mitochondrial [Condylostylus longicornis]